MTTVDRWTLYELTCDTSAPVIYIDKDNHGTPGGRGRQAHERACLSARAYCCAVKQGLIAADFDGLNGALYADDFSRYLEQQGLRPVALNSGGRGRAHVWCTVPPSLMLPVRAKIKALGGDDRTDSKIRPPFAPHRNGTSMSWRNGMTLEEAVRRLRVPENPTSEMTASSNGKKWGSAQQTCPYNPRTAPQKHSPVSEYPPKLNAKLETREDDRSVQIQSVAASMKSRGYSFEQFSDAILAHPNGAGSKMYFGKDGKSKPRLDKEKYLWRCWQKAYERATNTATPENGVDRAAVLPILSQIEAEARITSWPPRRHALFATVIVMVAKAREVGRLNVAYSCRQLAEEVGISFRSAINHLRWLEELGWIQKVKTATPLEGGQYAFIPRETETKRDYTLTHTPPTPKGCIGVCNLVGIIRDAFWGRGSARAAVIFLDSIDGPFTVLQFAKISNRSYESARQVLLKLESMRLVKRDGRQWTSRLTAEAIEAVAIKRGTAGRVERLKREHGWQREGWRQFAQDRKCFTGMVYRNAHGHSRPARPKEFSNEDDSQDQRSRRWRTLCAA